MASQNDLAISVTQQRKKTMERNGDPVAEQRQSQQMMSKK